MTVPLTPGQQHEVYVFDTLMHAGAVDGEIVCVSRVRPDHLSGDPSYTDNAPVRPAKIRLCAEQLTTGGARRGRIFPASVGLTHTTKGDDCHARRC